jgi:mono/diheme cytochrome c family protein
VRWTVMNRISWSRGSLGILLVTGALGAGCNVDAELDADGLGPEDQGQQQPGVSPSDQDHVGGFAGTGGTDIGGTAGTGGTTGTGDVPGGDSTWCQALSVFRTACQSCHAEQLAFGATFPLVTYEDTQALAPSGVPVHQAVGTRVHSPTSPMPPITQAPLSEAQLAAIDAWLAAGAPSAEDPTCGGAPEPDGPIETADFEWPADCEEHYEFRANDNGNPHRVRANSETHPDFLFDVPWGNQGTVQALAMRPITDNKRVLHHWILYAGTSTFLTGWSPGSEAEIAPEGIGVYMPSSGQLRLDLHYYNIGNNQDEYDNSGVEICITRNNLRPNTAGIFPFIASASAPANRTVTNEYTCTVNASEPIHLMGSSPHMHKLGTHATLEILRANGQSQMVHDLPFSFDDQYAVALEDVVLHSGDQVKISCTYVNPTGSAVSFGIGSDDEMCFNFARYYPRCGFTCSGGNIALEIIKGI